MNRSLPHLDPDEILLDAQNLPELDTQQFEGRLERPIKKIILVTAAIIFTLAQGAFLSRAFFLQVVRGDAYAERSANNSLKEIVIFPDRGLIYDREGRLLVWNDEGGRYYSTSTGLAHTLGYVSIPTQEDLSTTTIHRAEWVGREGVEAMFDRTLAGQKGLKLEEASVRGNIVSDHILEQPEKGKDLTISIDARLQSKLFDSIKGVATDRGFRGGAGVIMDVKTGELLALTSYPEYDSNVLSRTRESSLISGYLKDVREPFLNRAIGGRYTPGSIIKPFIAAAALAEKIVSPTKTFVSTGELIVPNPYNPSQNSIFKDWKAHGVVDMRRALAVSSNVYFYQIGGGYRGQPGLGITKIAHYSRLFGFDQPTGINLPGETKGLVPTPEWKAENFDGEDWLLGDTYHTAIGQYGFLVTPLQMVRAVTAIATDGRMPIPTILAASTTPLKPATLINLSRDDLQIVREGMRLAVREGTAKGLSYDDFAVAAKTGTAELGSTKEKVNSWVIGFFPYENPRYAFAVVMEKGESTNTIGGVYVMRQTLDWLRIYAPKYLESEPFLTKPDA